MPLLCLPSAILEEVIFYRLLDVSQRRWPAPKSDISNLCLVHRRLKDLVQALTWRHVTLDTANQTRFVRCSTRWNEEQRRTKLSTIKILVIQGEGFLTGNPELLSHMRLTSLSLQASLSRAMAIMVVNQLRSSQLRRLEIVNATPRFPSNLEDYRELLMYSAPTLEKLYLRSLKDIETTVNPVILPTFPCLRFVSINTLHTQRGKQSIVAEVFAKSPKFEKMILEGEALTSRRLLDSCKDRITTLCLRGLLQNPGEVVAMPLPKLKKLKVDDIQLSLLSNSKQLLSCFSGKIERLELHSIWRAELLKVSTVLLADARILTHLTSLAIAGPNTSLEEEQSWALLEELCERRGTNVSTIDGDCAAHFARSFALILFHGETQ